MEYADWCARTDSELATQDIARVNLTCAIGLPGSEDLDFDACIATLEDWTDRVRDGTDRAIHNRAAYPELDELSEPEYRILTMFAVLFRHIGLTLNIDCQDSSIPYDGSDSRDHFIHAVVTDRHPATCCTAPVVFAAIGRRLGYPIKLVKTREHIFCRWDDPKGDRFNIEATNQGYYRYDDDHYRHWPKPVDTESIRRGKFLQSLASREELALFLDFRALCFLENLRLAEAVEASLFACQADPHEHFFQNGWKIATLMRRAQQYDWKVPPPHKSWECAALPAARRTLTRILANRERKYAALFRELSSQEIVLSI
jgi:hypothetical protein